jgi:hypothetical protein
MTHSNESIRQLTETVNTLAMVVAKNESRYLSIERAFRWVAIAFLCLVMMIFYMGFNMFSQVQATIIGESLMAETLKDIRHILKDESELESFVKDVGRLVHNMAVLTDDISECEQKQESTCSGVGEIIQNVAILTHWLVACKDNPEKSCADPEKTIVGNNIAAMTRKIVAFDRHFAQDFSKALNQPFKEKELTLGAAMADILILIHRLKLDSDALRTTTTSDGRTIHNSHSGLISTGSIHDALIMLHREIQFMNSSMNVMVHSMGPTMGRMGTMMNSMPMMNTVPW